MDHEQLYMSQSVFKSLAVMGLLNKTGEFTKSQMHKKLEIAIHQFAKRQMTWFRKMEREGTKIYWLDGHMPLEKKIDRAKAILHEYDIVTD